MSVAGDTLLIPVGLGDTPQLSIAATSVKSGPGDVETVQFSAPTQVGSYFYRCDVHPTIMTGNLVVGATPR